MNRPFKLYRLQQIDTQIDAAVAQLGEVEKQLKDDASVIRARKNAEVTILKYKEKLKALNQAEQKVEMQRLKIEQSENKLYSGSVTNPKQLEDLHNEVSALKRYRSVLEDRLLESMLEEEDVASEKNIAVLVLEEEQVRFNQLHESLTVEKDKLEKVITQLNQQRNAATSSILEQDLILYNQIRQQRHGIAVAKVTDKACSACGTTLSAMLLHAARSPDQINRCETCGRILYLG